MKTRATIPFLSLILVLALTACGAQAPNQVTGKTINVSGSGSVFLTPDIATIYIGVHIENPDISTAVETNNTQTQQVLDALKTMGVEAKDLQTSNYSIYTSQQYNPETGTYFGTTYVVDNTVYVTVRDLSKMPALLDGVLQAGANNINSIQFDVADKSEAFKQARKLAAEHTAALAQEMAANAGVSLGAVKNISYSEPQVIPTYAFGKGGGGGAEGPSTVVSIHPGQMEVTVNVSITYEINP